MQTVLFSIQLFQTDNIAVLVYLSLVYNVLKTTTAYICISPFCHRNHESTNSDNRYIAKLAFSYIFNNIIKTLSVANENTKPAIYKCKLYLSP